MLSTFHNRRWDNDYLVLRDILASGVIGDVFRIEAGFNGYHKQRDWWRSSKAVSGGSIYDWGAHFTDWILSLVPAKITSVTGFQAKHPAWKDYTNEDHSEYSLQFDNGCLATLTMSNLSAIDRPRWVLRGTNGSITAAQFLQRFVNDVPWAHLDIAGTAFSAGSSEVNASWAPGFGVALLDRLVRDYYQS